MRHFCSRVRYLERVRNKLKRPNTIYNDLKRSKNDLKRPKITNINWLTKDFGLRFSNIGRDSVQNERCRLKNKKLGLWIGPWDRTSSYNLDLEPLGPCNSKPLKQSKATGRIYFWKWVAFKISQYSQENTYVGVSF